jgi:hypothetical protein
MTIYMLLPFMAGDTIEMKEKGGYTSKGALVREYSKRFGEKNEYYIELCETSGSKNLHYDISDRCQKTYYYDAFRPCDITRR